MTEKISVAEYLEREKYSEVRHEFVDGVMIAMAGEKRPHNRLSRRFVLLLEVLAESKKWRQRRLVHERLRYESGCGESGCIDFQRRKGCRSERTPEG